MIRQFGPKRYKIIKKRNKTYLVDTEYHWFLAIAPYLFHLFPTKAYVIKKGNANKSWYQYSYFKLVMLFFPLVLLGELLFFHQPSMVDIPNWLQPLFPKLSITLAVMVIFRLGIHWLNHSLLKQSLTREQLVVDFERPEFFEPRYNRLVDRQLFQVSLSAVFLPLITIFCLLAVQTTPLVILTCWFAVYLMFFLEKEPVWRYYPRQRKYEHTKDKLLLLEDVAVCQSPAGTSLIFFWVLFFLIASTSVLLALVMKKVDFMYMALLTANVFNCFFVTMAIRNKLFGSRISLTYLGNEQQFLLTIDDVVYEIPTSSVVGSSAQFFPVKNFSLYHFTLETNSQKLEFDTTVREIGYQFRWAETFIEQNQLRYYQELDNQHT